MNCPYRESLMPRCDIAMHPYKRSVEYCRVCGEWRNIHHVGEEMPDILWFLLGVGILLLVLQAAIPEAEPPPPSESPYGLELRQP